MKIRRLLPQVAFRGSVFLKWVSTLLLGTLPGAHTEPLLSLGGVSSRGSCTNNSTAMHTPSTKRGRQHLAINPFSKYAFRS